MPLGYAERMGENNESGLDDLVATLDAALDETFEERLRAELALRERSWLVDQLARRVLRERHVHAHEHRRLTRHLSHVESTAQRHRRLERIERLGLDESALRAILGRYRALDRATLESKGYLISPPHEGEEALGPDHRSAEGERLLEEAHDLFYALLFCEAAQGVHLTRARRDFLTVTLPSKKADSLKRFMLAVTETSAAGTWLDPDGVSDDIDARNTVLQVEFGDTPDTMVCDALIAVLRMINNLEVNEEILYARIEQLEKSTLID